MPGWIFIKKNPTSPYSAGYTYSDSALKGLDRPKPEIALRRIVQTATPQAPAHGAQEPAAFKPVRM
jgi:hypothetical protein